MPSNNSFTFNSNEFAFADIKVNILGAELSGLRGLTYKKTQAKELVFGAGNEPKSVQRGNKNYDGSLKLLKSDYDDMHDAAIAAGYDDLLDVPSKEIVITCVYDKEDGTPLKTDILLNCEFTEVEDGQNQGDKFKEVTLPFIFLRLKNLK